MKMVALVRDHFFVQYLAIKRQCGVFDAEMVN